MRTALDNARYDAISYAGFASETSYRARCQTSETPTTNSCPRLFECVASRGVTQYTHKSDTGNSKPFSGFFARSPHAVHHLAATSSELYTLWCGFFNAGFRRANRWRDVRQYAARERRPSSERFVNEALGRRIKAGIKSRADSEGRAVFFPPTLLVRRAVVTRTVRKHAAR